MSGRLHDDEARSKRRFGWLIERHDGADFPFYDGDPLAISTPKWIAVIAACAVGFFALSLIPATNEFSGLVSRILFPAVPLGLFIAFTGSRWTALFRRLRLVDFGTMIVFWILNAAISGLVAVLLRALGANPQANSTIGDVTAEGAGELVAFYVGTGIQLFGEEIFTILPFLAVMYWMYAKAGTSRTTAVLTAWLITAVWFGAAHLPTYDWNIAQALIGIGIARLVLTLAYIRTKNIGVSTGAHILNDWSAFTLALLTAR